MNNTTNPDPSSQLSDKHSDQHSDQLSDRATFVRGVALTLAPQADYSVSRLTLILGRYISWAQESRGLPLIEQLLFNSHTIDLYIRDQVREKKLAKSSVAAYRSVLLRASEVFLPVNTPLRTRTISAPTMLPPYTPAEVDAFPIWARGQRTELLQQKAIALMCLGLGCGLRAGEISTVHKRDVHDDGGITVTVENERGTRSVPMLDRYHGVFRQLIADRSDDAFVFGRPSRAVHRNTIAEFVTEARTPRLHVSSIRMRTTWILGRLIVGVELRTLLHAANLDRLEKLGDYLPHLPPPTEVSRSLLGIEATR
jgi:integrase